MSRLTNSYWINRTVCDVLEDMRKCCKTSNFSALPGLIEEVQIKADRMEAGLGDKRDLAEMEEEWHKIKKEIKKLRRKRDKLKNKKTK